MGYGLWAMGYGLWAMGYGLLAIGYWLLAIGYGLWAMGKENSKSETPVKRKKHRFHRAGKLEC
jgi:hypothetical protein